MRVVNRRWRCDLCGAALEVGPGERVATMIIGSSGKLNVRAVSVGRREIHRCESGLDSLQNLRAP